MRTSKVACSQPRAASISSAATWPIDGIQSACDRLHGGGEWFYEGDRSPEATAEFRRAFARVWLDATSTPVRNSAHELGNFLLVREPQMEGEGDPRDIARTYGVLLRNFLTAAQRDLGIDPPEPEEPVGGTQQGA